MIPPDITAMHVLVGWVASLTMLFIGFGIGVVNYRPDETPPDVDKSPEGSA